MHDDVLNAMDRCLHQFDVQCNSACGAATSPPRAHDTNCQQWLRDTVTRCNGVALVHVTVQGLPSPFTKPCVYHSSDAFSVRFVFHPDPKKAPQQFGWLSRSRFDFQSILASQINEGLSTDISFRRWQRVISLHFVEGLRNPRCLLLNSLTDFVFFGTVRGKHIHGERWRHDDTQTLAAGTMQAVSDLARTELNAILTRSALHDLGTITIATAKHKAPSSRRANSEERGVHSRTPQ